MPTVPPQSIEAAFPESPTVLPLSSLDPLGRAPPALRGDKWLVDLQRADKWLLDAKKQLKELSKQLQPV